VKSVSLCILTLNQLGCYILANEEREEHEEHLVSRASRRKSRKSVKSAGMQGCLMFRFRQAGRRKAQRLWRDELTLRNRPDLSRQVPSFPVAVIYIYHTFRSHLLLFTTPLSGTVVALPKTSRFLLHVTSALSVEEAGSLDLSEVELQHHVLRVIFNHHLLSATSVARDSISACVPPRITISKTILVENTIGSAVAISSAGS
jgi:hypothetical protein